MYSLNSHPQSGMKIKRQSQHVQEDLAGCNKNVMYDLPMAPAPGPTTRGSQDARQQRDGVADRKRRVPEAKATDCTTLRRGSECPDPIREAWIIADDPGPRGEDSSEKILSDDHRRRFENPTRAPQARGGTDRASAPILAKSILAPGLGACALPAKDGAYAREWYPQRRANPGQR